MTWTTFDRFARYTAVGAALAANFDGDASVLDVGDGSGYLHAFTGRPVVSVDLAPSVEPLAGTPLVCGSGAALPFRDGQFDVVISCDALEHVPPPLRPGFLAEMARVARSGLVIAAPFATSGVAGSELLVERYAALATGRPQEQLDEHRTNGLPDVSETMESLAALGMDAAAKGNGNLQDWTLMMLLKYQIGGRSALMPLGDALDSFYNTVLRHRNDVAPFYRHVIVATRGRRPELPASEPRPDGLTDDTVLSLLGGLAATTFGEVERQDVEPGLIAIQTALQQLSGREQEYAPLSAIADVEGSLHRVDERLAAIEKELGAVSDATEVILDRVAVVRAEFERTISAMRHPLATLRRRRRRQRGRGSSAAS